METSDYITIYDKDDPLYIYIGCVYILGNCWVVYILLVNHGELICKAKGDFAPERQWSMSPILRLDSVVPIPVFPERSLEGKASSYVRTGETGRLPVHGWEGSRACGGCLRAAGDRAAALCPGRLPGAPCHPWETRHRHPQAPPGTAPEKAEEKPTLSETHFLLLPGNWAETGKLLEKCNSFSPAIPPDGFLTVSLLNDPTSA